MSTLLTEANPIPYVALNHKGRGLLLGEGGAGEFEFSILGIVNKDDHSLCSAPGLVGSLDEFASVQSSSTVEEVEVEYINTGTRLREELDIIRSGLNPLRSFYISDVIGRNISGGKTIYGIEVSTDCPDVLYLGVASRMRIKEDFIFKGWRLINPGQSMARPVVSGLEFKILLYTKGAGRFNIYSLKAWMKLTDRRGFNTSPGSVKQQ